MSRAGHNTSRPGRRAADNDRPLGPGRGPARRPGWTAQAAGADFFLLACNTVHTASERVEQLTGLPLLHIVDPAARQIRQAGFTTVGLLGSRDIMTGTYFAGRLRRHYRPDVLVAEDEHQDNVQRAVRRAGPRRRPARHPGQVPGRDHGLVARGAEVIVLACTEFGMVVQAGDSPVPVIDTTIVHAQGAVEMALNDEPVQPGS